ncbi:hypothetical protein QFC24_001352 [Naganishia onofrii]|uniref:Uncharacterized protein n=1 Tax=Naganishia onofrii TaxID=1851511 RepID=A0ACC2XT20_9TREE|nr:hypothetical protein QFC24_001352 [Naganishia onofrii]
MTEYRYTGGTDPNGHVGDPGEQVRYLSVFPSLSPFSLGKESDPQSFTFSPESGSAFPATLAIQIRQLADEGFTLDSVVTVIDCVNFTGYEDSSPTAKIQAKYTDCLLLNKHDLVTERQLDTVLDHLYELNDETPMIRVSKEHPLDPSLVFGLDTKLFARGSEEIADWKTIVADGGVGERSNHSDEIETVSVWRGGGRPGKGNTKKRDIAQVDGKTMDGGHKHHEHADGEACACASSDAGEEDHVEVNGAEEAVSPVDVEALTAGLAKLPFEIYRVKGFLRIPTKEDPNKSDIHILNWAFGRSEITPAPSLNDSESLQGVSFRLTMMGARGEVVRRARTFAAVMQGEYA